MKPQPPRRCALCFKPTTTKDHRVDIDQGKGAPRIQIWWHYACADKDETFQAIADAMSYTRPNPPGGIYCPHDLTEEECGETFVVAYSAFHSALLKRHGDLGPMMTIDVRRDYSARLTIRGPGQSWGRAQRRYRKRGLR